VGTVATPMRERASVQAYLDKYSEAMTSGDTKTLAKLWGVPAFVIGAMEARVVQSEDEVEQFFAGAKEMYNARGIMDTRAEILDLDWISDDLVIAKVRWPYIDQNGKTVGEETSSYTLLRGEDGGFKLRVVTMRGASPAQSEE
jgi:ketosteroid isomerase-like protein